MSFQINKSDLPKTYYSWYGQLGWVDICEFKDKKYIGIFTNHQFKEKRVKVHNDTNGRKTVKEISGIFYLYDRTHFEWGMPGKLISTKEFNEQDISKNQFIENSLLKLYNSHQQQLTYTVK